MRPPSGATLLAVSYGAGLATGLARFPDPVVTLPILLAAAIVLRQSWRAAVAAALACGMASGMLARQRADASCARVLPLGERTMTLRAIDPGPGLGRVTATRPGCHGELLARWPRGATIPAGTTVTVCARLLPPAPGLTRPGGLLLVRKVVRVEGAPDPVDRLRTWLAATSRRLYGDDAPLVDAFVTGRRGGVAADVKQAFAASGLVHLLAISGFHVALVSGWLLLLLRRLGAPRRPAEGAAALAALGYAAFLGWPAPALRAAVMLVVVLICRWRQRNPRDGALLATSALVVLLVDPWAIVDIGGWLSVVALAGVQVATRWSDRALGDAEWIRGLAGSVGALFATAPITAFAFGAVAPISVLLNLVAVPLTAVLVPVFLVSLGVWPLLPVLAQAFAASAAVLLRLLIAIATLGASAPGASAAGPGGWGRALPWLLGAAVAWWIVRDGSTAREAGRRLAWSATAALWLLLALPETSRADLGDGRLTLLFLDVGQGDAALLRTPGGHWVAIDAGPADASGDAGRRVIVPWLRTHGVARLDAFVLSHAHRDHVGGAAALLDALPVGVAIEPGRRFADDAYDAWLGALAAKGVRWHAASPGDAWTLDGVTFRVLHPPPRWAHRDEDLNEDSLVLEVTCGDFRALFTGDAGVKAESLLVRATGDVDLLKIGHHGSRGASGTPFLHAIGARVGVVSVGRNRYGHPSPEAMARWRDAGLRVWRTDEEGTIAVVTDGHTFTVRGGRTTATYAARPRRRRARPHQGHHARTLHSRPGTVPPRCHGGTHQPPLRRRPRREADRGADPSRGAGQHPGGGGVDQRAGRGAAEARRLRQRDHEARAEPHRTRLCDGLRGR